ncbi:MAG: glycoside hydrolase family 97 protein [Rikenellaceae bacterium]|jgi:hypothetical protein|nr:glycoside hydrolase family 97 protein [Rikenellaceae bacterium]
MKGKLYALFFALIAVLFSACGSNSNDVVSPNGEIRVQLTLTPTADSEYGTVSFAVEYGRGKSAQTLLSGVTLGMETDAQHFTDGLKLISVSEPTPIEEAYKMITGKRSHCFNSGTERKYRFENEAGGQFDVVFRAYNDGVVFRYDLTALGEGTEYILSESTVYPIPQGTNRWMQTYAIDYEGFFPLNTDGSVAGRSRFPNYWGYPALVEPQEAVFVLITEANIRRGHSGSRLYNGNSPDRYEVQMPDEKVAFSGAWSSPWRVLMVGSLADIVESTLVTDVSEPSQVGDTSWIKPGPASWVYWAYNHGSKDFQIVKDYIDLAAEMGWPYDLIDWEWDVMENGGTIDDALSYAHERGVKPLLWYNSGTSWIGPGAPGPLDRLIDKATREQEYAMLNGMGVAGIKIDFFAIDGAEMMNYYIDLLEDAAKYNLLITLHGATIPRGWQRTYPHLMTTEAVYGAEWYNNNPLLTPRAAAHNATLPFTRNVIGSMDYTPGTFSDSQNPHITTHGHELALYVVFESALQHMPDRPDVYRALPEAVKTLLSGLPTAWDDTRLLGGYPGEEVIIARRKGDTWYIGGLNGTEDARTLRFTPATLGIEGLSIALFKDGADPRSFTLEDSTPILDPTAEIAIDCLPRGGFTAVIH